MKQCPRAPIVLGPTAGPTFNALGLQFYLRAGSVDTDCMAEIAQVTIPAGFTSPVITDFASNISVSVNGGGSLVVMVNGVDYTLPAGGFAFIKAGSPFRFTNLNSNDSSFLLVATGPGTLGFFDEVSAYQTAIGGGAQNLDACIVDNIARKYCIAVSGLRQRIYVCPGTLKLFPTVTKDCDPTLTNGTWGLRAGELLVISVTGVDTTLAVKPSVTIEPHQYEAAIIVGTSLGAVSLVARVLRDPSCGVPEALACPTINGQAEATVVTGVAYYVLYDSSSTNVILSPILTL